MVCFLFEGNHSIVCLCLFSLLMCFLFVCCFFFKQISCIWPYSSGPVGFGILKQTSLGDFSLGTLRMSWRCMRMKIVVVAFWSRLVACLQGFKVGDLSGFGRLES